MAVLELLMKAHAGVLWIKQFARTMGYLVESDRDNVPEQQKLQNWRPKTQ